MSDLDRKGLLRRLSRLKGPDDCPSIATLGVFADGQLGPVESQAVEEHLQSCPRCVNQLIDLREFARLQKEGPEPPPDVVRQVKRFVLPPEPEKLPAFTNVTRMLKSASGGWATLRDWHILRFTAELSVACAAVLIDLRIGGWTISRAPSATQPGTSQVESVAGLSPEERTILRSLSLAPFESLTLDKRIVSALDNLPKTLLLEESRGPNDVEIYKRAAPATVLVVTDKSLGSGVTIDRSGDVVTNWHVIAAAKKVTVVFKPERGLSVKKELAYAAVIGKVDQVADLALLKVNTPSKTVSFLPLANMDTVEVGQDVHAIGHPDGEVWTYTTGIISQIRPAYQWTGADNLQHLSKVIQTQTAMNPGNSGGPLLNDRGEIIGINSFRREGEGLSYAVAADVVSEFLRRAESRVAATVPPQAPSAYRVERYGRNIVGAYLKTAVPPPDLWLVYGESGGTNVNVKYSAMGRVERTRLDTVITLRESSLAYYFDVDCDGTIDLIGYAEPGGDTLTRYERPTTQPQLSSMIGELTVAFENGTIPYRQVRVCQ